MEREDKTGFKIICLKCGSEDCYHGAYKGISTIICRGCGQEDEED